MPDFIPTTDEGKRTFGLNLSTKLTAAPTDYSITVAQAAAFQALFDSYDAALTTALEPSTRTPTAIVNKDLARDAMVQNARRLARIIQAAPSVTPGQKTDLGLPIHDEEPTPSIPPQFAPGVEIVSVTGRTVRVKLRDTQSTRRGKPDGVIAAVVISYQGDETPTAASNWRYEGSTGRMVSDVVFPDTLAAGAKVWISAFWLNDRKEAGPAATPLSTFLQGGAEAAA